MKYEDLLKAVLESKASTTFRAKIVATMHAAPESDNHSQGAMEHASPKEIAAWAPIVPDVSTSDNSKMGSDDLLTASKSDVMIRVKNASDLYLETLGQITCLSDAQVAKYPALLNRFDPHAAMKEDTVFAFAMRGDELVASVHATRSCEGADRLLHIGNLNSDKSVRSIATPLMAALILGDNHWAGSPANAEGIARVLPNGDVNIGSTKTMMRIGFYTSKFFTHPATTRNPQKTGEGSIEPDGAELKYLLQKGDASEILALSKTTLTGWSLRFGKTKTS